MTTGQQALVAVLERRGRFLVALPLFGRRGEAESASTWGRGQITVDLDRSGARPGDLVLVGRSQKRRGGGRAVVLRRLGRPDVARDVIEALLLDRGMQRRFEEDVERAAREARPERQGRRDLRTLATFTIDPTGARDYDDAISAEDLGDGVTRVRVHIADVVAHVPEDGPVDREARRRATSVYVPGAVEPMLPPALSNEACSLVPGEDRLAVTVELDMRAAGLERTAVYRSVIRSDERLDYDRVDRIFAGQEIAHEPWARPLGLARGVARELERQRHGRGALEIASGEPEFVFDAAGHVTSIEVGEQTESHRLIEHLMVCANEQVAQLLQERKLPTLYRVHEQPDPERVERLLAQLASLGVPTPPAPERMSPSQAGELIGEISQAIARHVKATGRGRIALTSLLLRSLKQAYYSPHNIGHAGLRSPSYCHFTSPIRRYPDLVCHRGLLHAVGVGDPAPAAAGMVELGEWTSTMERRAMDIERTADAIARCFALQRETGEREWDGEVVGLIAAGAFVAFGGGYEGMLPVRRMRGDWWELNEQGTVLHGTRSGSAIRLGDPVRVRVYRIDAPRGRVDLELA